MQHDIFNNKNLKSVIDEIISCDNIITKDDFKEDEVNLSHAIHTAIKRCKQFSDEHWKNFQNFFMLSKKDNDETNSYRLILFLDLECWLFLHQLYTVFIMLIKVLRFSDENFLENEMRIDKIIFTLIFWILNTWLINNK